MDPGSSSSDSAPDCWDQVDMETPGSGLSEDGISSTVAEAQSEHLSSVFSRQLNVNAKPFVPNIHAEEFVPSFLRGSVQPPNPLAASVSISETCTGAGDLQEELDISVSNFLKSPTVDSDVAASIPRE